MPDARGRQEYAEVRIAVTPFERRLPASLHAMMAAYSAAETEIRPWSELPTDVEIFGAHTPKQRVAWKAELAEARNVAQAAWQTGNVNPDPCREL